MQTTDQTTTKKDSNRAICDRWLSFTVSSIALSLKKELNFCPISIFFVYQIFFFVQITKNFFFQFYPKSKKSKSKINADINIKLVSRKAAASLLALRNLLTCDCGWSKHSPPKYTHSFVYTWNVLIHQSSKNVRYAKVQVCASLLRHHRDFDSGRCKAILWLKIFGWLL